MTSTYGSTTLTYFTAIPWPCERWCLSLVSKA